MASSLRLALLAVILPVMAAPEPPRLSFRSTFSGVAADGEHCLWQGPVGGALQGRVTILLRQIEPAEAAANPVWHVASRWVVSDAGTAPTFSADLEGTIDWKTGTLHLSGRAAEGWQQGSWVHVDGRLVDADLVGSLTLASAPRR
jgi:hypothetical protein